MFGISFTSFWFILSIVESEPRRQQYVYIVVLGSNRNPVLSSSNFSVFIGSYVTKFDVNVHRLGKFYFVRVSVFFFLFVHFGLIVDGFLKILLRFTVQHRMKNIFEARSKLDRSSSKEVELKVTVGVAFRTYCVPRNSNTVVTVSKLVFIL